MAGIVICFFILCYHAWAGLVWLLTFIFIVLLLFFELRWKFKKEKKKVSKKERKFFFFSWSLSWMRPCFFSWPLSFFLDRFFGRERVFFLFFLDRFLGRKRVFLFSYFLVFFYKFPPEILRVFTRFCLFMQSSQKRKE